MRTGLLVTTAVFFTLQLTRLLVVAAAEPRRRVAMLLLAAGVALWSAGSATVSASQAVSLDDVTFPAPGEALYLLSYLGIVCFLLLDVPRRRLPAAAVWLEGAVVCGAAVCVAAFAVLTPLQHAFDRGGVTLLLAVLYPLIDLGLGTLVLAQMLLRQRDRTRRTALLAGSFLALAVADSSFILTLSSDSYTSSIALDVLWGSSWAVLVSAACARPGRAVVVPKPASALTLVAAASAALAVLVLRPSGAIGALVTVPAIVTLVCAGARMVLALNEARGAAEAMRLSLTDELTGLPNRRAVLAAADESLRAGTPLGFMLLDLDGFKDINDSLGHGTGDDVLTTVAHRMRAAVTTDVLVARLGGDEFALLTPFDDELELLETAHRVREVLTPVRIDTLDLTIGSSIGITVRTPDDTTATDLLRRADIAMYEAKEARSGALLYDTSQDGFSAHRLRRAEDLRQGIAAGQLVLWYQPQVDAATRTITAMEALVRWEHPTEGLLTPAAFLPDARRAGLMPALSEAVMRHVVVDARRFTDAGFRFRVAMNCAPPELLGGQLLPRLFEALDAVGLPGDAVLIEVTEDSFLSDPERARDALHDLRAHDVQASIDDYGTGFSSLAYLRDLPVQELKMDRSFVSTLLTDDRARLIVETTTKMAHAMGLRLVAEGVEDEETARALVAMDVDVLQGYHIAAPMPVEAVGPWARRWATQPVPELRRLLPVPRGR